MQLKWVALAAGVLGLVYAYSSSRPKTYVWLEKVWLPPRVHG